MRTRARLIRTAGCVAGAALLTLTAACGSSGGGKTSDAALTAALKGQPKAWQQVIKGAFKEGTLTFYTTTNDSGNFAVIKAFNQVYPGIKVKYTRLPDANAAARISQEYKAGVNALDVTLVGEPEVLSGNGKIFAKLSPTLLPELAKYPKSAARWPWGEITAENTYAIAYNTNAVKGSDIPTQWKDVLSPKFKGQIAYASPVGSATHMGWLQGMQHFYGDSFLQQYRNQDFKLFDSGDPAAQAVVAGSDKLGMIVYPSTVTDLISKGAPIKYVIPKPVLLKPNLMGIAAKAPHPDAARLFANFLLGTTGTSVECKKTVVAASIPNVPGCIQLSPGAYSVQDLWTTAQAAPLIKLVGLKPNS